MSLATRWSERCGCEGKVSFKTPGNIKAIDNSVDPVCLLMKSVITQLVLDKQQYEDHTCHPYGESCDIYERIGLVFFNIPSSDL